MLLRYDIEKLQQMLRDFHNLTGICVCVLDREFQKLAAFPSPTNRFCMMIQSSPEGHRRCFASDLALLRSCEEKKAPVIHRCHAGLTDLAVPILHDDVLLGYILFGQLRRTEQTPAAFEEIRLCVKDLKLDTASLLGAYRELIFFDREKLQSAASLVEMLTKHIWLEQLIDPIVNDRFEEIPAYIDSHLTEELTVSALCRRFHLSKNTLYDYFKTYTGYTVKDYVNQRRIVHAERLLISTDLPIYEICEQVGIDNPHYFCKVFHQKKGETPLQFRKKKRAEVSATAFHGNTDDMRKSDP